MTSSSSKSSLVLIAQLAMLLIFAVASAACLRVFVSAYTGSVSDSKTSLAVIKAQEAAEIVKNCGGDLEEACKTLGGTELYSASGYSFVVYYGDDMTPVTDGGQEVFAVIVEYIESDSEYLGRAKVSVCDAFLWEDESYGAASSEIYAIEFAWQEELK